MYLFSIPPFDTPATSRPSGRNRVRGHYPDVSNL